MLTAAIIHAKNHCGCPNCVAQYEAATEEEIMITELRDEMNHAGLCLVESIEHGYAMRAAA